MEFYWAEPLFHSTADFVSIPNGMEFYRDRELFSRERGDVSIPNGMEFYAMDDLEGAIKGCFNSQRDGILLYFVV